MSATEQEVAQLKEQIAKGAEETKSYLETLKGKVAEYDSHYQVSETATGYLQSGMDRAHASVDELRALPGRISQGSKETSAAWVASAQDAIARVHSSLAHLKERAGEYDQRTRTTVTTTVVSAKDTVSSSLEAIVTGTRQRASTTMETLSSTVASVQNAITQRALAVGHGAFVRTGDAVKTVESVDARLGVSTTISSTVTAVTDRVTSLDSKLGVSATAMSLDTKISGGMGQNLVHKGLDYVNQGVEYVTTTLQQAKDSSDLSAAAAVETVQPVVAEPTAEAKKKTEA